MTVAEVKEKLTHLEFLDWLEYYRQDERRRTKEDYYSAAVRLELVRLIRLTERCWVKGVKPSKEPGLETFLLEYTDERASAPAKSPNSWTPTDGKVYTSASKAAWMARLGMFGG